MLTSEPPSVVSELLQIAAAALEPPSVVAGFASPIAVEACVALLHTLAVASLVHWTRNLISALAQAQAAAEGVMGSVALEFRWQDVSEEQVVGHLRSTSLAGPDKNKLISHSSLGRKEHT